MPIINQWNSQQVVYGQNFAETVVSALKTAPTNPLVTTGKLRLSQDPSFNPTSTSTIALLAAGEAAYTGYAAGGIAVSLTVGLILSGAAVGALTTGLFLATSSGSFVSANVTGWWIDDGTNVIAAEAFPSGTVAAFQQGGDFLDLNAFLPFRLNQQTS